MPSTLQAVAWARRPLPFLERCQKHFGDTFTIRVRHAGTWVILADPEDVKRVFTADHAVLGVGLANSVLGPLLGPRSVMLLEEPEHVKRRKLMLPPFHGERMQGYSEMMADVTRRELASWPIDEPFELWPRMQEITLEAIMRVVFGPLETDRLGLLRARLRRLTNWMNDPRRLNLLAAAGPSRFAGNSDYHAMMGPVEDSVLEEVRRRQLDPDCTDGSDIAAMLGEARYEDGSPMTEQDLRDELVTLLTDGPTSSLLSWTFERLLRHPDKLARLRAELETDDGDYLDAVVKETMRLCPAAPIVVRRLLAPMELGGYMIPAGTTVAPCVHLVHRRPEIYPEPLRFRPERFLERPAGTYTWIPFGGGVRRCLAASYAQLLMKQVIGTVVREVDLQAVDPRSELPRKSAIAFVPHRHATVIVRQPHAPGRRPKPATSALTLTIALLISLALGACGGTGKTTVSASGANSSASQTASTTTSPAATASTAATETASTATQAKPPSNTDVDKDGDENADDYRYGSAANPSDRRAVTAILTRYYAAAAAGDGRTGCALTYSLFAEEIPELYGTPSGPPGLRGKTCVEVLTKLFKQTHQQLRQQNATLKVLVVRVHELRALVVLDFKPLGVREIIVHREHHAWRIDELEDVKLG